MRIETIKGFKMDMFKKVHSAEELAQFVKNANCHYIDPVNPEETAIKIIPNNDTFGYIQAGLLKSAMDEMYLRKLTGCESDMDRVLSELLRSTFKIQG